MGLAQAREGGKDYRRRIEDTASRKRDRSVGGECCEGCAVYGLVFSRIKSVWVHCVETISGTKRVANARCNRICLVIAKGKCGRQGSLLDAQAMCVPAESDEVQCARVKEGQVQVALVMHLVLVVPHHSLDVCDGHCRSRLSRREGQGDAGGERDA